MTKPTPCAARCTFHTNRTNHIACRYCEPSHTAAPRWAVVVAGGPPSTPVSDGPAGRLVPSTERDAR